jgi:hypothetical protein
MEKALAYRERLARENPTVTEYQRDLAASYRSLAIIQIIQGHDGPAEAAFRASAQIRERLTHDHPQVVDFAIELCGMYEPGDRRP